jgi:hypothetical protein
MVYTQSGIDGPLRVQVNSHSQHIIKTSINQSKDIVSEEGEKRERGVRWKCSLESEFEKLTEEFNTI